MRGIILLIFTGIMVGSDQKLERKVLSDLERQVRNFKQEVQLSQKEDLCRARIEEHYEIEIQNVLSRWYCWKSRYEYLLMNRKENHV